MQKLLTVSTLTLCMLASSAFARGSPSYTHETYNGGGGTRGYTSSTGFVKERNDEQNHIGADDCARTANNPKDEEDCKKAHAEKAKENEKAPVAMDGDMDATAETGGKGDDCCDNTASGAKKD